jgi:hypothetical protein
MPQRTSRIVDRLDPRLLGVLTVLGFGLPVAGYFWMVGRYSVNVVVADQWSDVAVIAHSYDHLFDWQSLWGQHNENRIFFPNLIVLVIARTTAFNVQIEAYLGGLMLLASTGLLIWSHKRRSAGTPWLYYCPAVILIFSVVQYENMLWGFQMAWWLVLLSLAATIALVDRIKLTWPVFVAAILTAAVGSYSSLQGLLIWVAGLVLLCLRGRWWPFIVTWLGAAVVTAVVYFWNFNSKNLPDHNWAIHHPWPAIKFFVFAVGDIVGYQQANGKPDSTGVVVLGLVVLCLAIWSIAQYGFRRDESGPGPIGIALIWTGLLFAALITEGRSVLGPVEASASRYTTFDLLIPMGILLVLVGRPIRERSATAAWILASVIVIQSLLGIHYGVTRAKGYHADNVRAAAVLRNINREPDAVEDTVAPYYSKSAVDQGARVLENHHLSLFAG